MKAKIRQIRKKKRLDVFCDICTEKIITIRDGDKIGPYWDLCWKEFSGENTLELDGQED